MSQPTVHDPVSTTDNRLVVAISSRALFDLGDSHALFERDGLDAYRAFQIEHEEDILRPGVAFPLVQKLLGLNKLAGDVPPVEVILLSRNSGDTGLRIFNAIQHYGLEISPVTPACAFSTRSSITAWKSAAPHSPAVRRRPTTSRRSRPTCSSRPTPRTSAARWPPAWPRRRSCPAPRRRA